YLGDVEAFSDLHPIIDDYMDYHNTERYQWKLAKLSPNQYYDYSSFAPLRTPFYPLHYKDYLD
ncbi:IS3 family transposase, partial [Alkalibacterium sp. m-11]